MENQGFDEIYKIYGKMLYRTAYLYLGNSADTEDVLQEVFIKYLTSHPDFFDENHEKAWLILVTRNCCRNFVRKNRKGNVTLEEYDAPAVLPDSDEKLDIIKAINVLPQKYREVMILYYYNGLTIDKIAKLLSITQSGVKMRLKRGKERLKISLEGYENE